MGGCSMASRIVGGYSTARRKRQHAVNGMRRAAEAEPCGQWDATRGVRRQIAEIEDDQAEAATFEKQIRGTQNLLQAAFRLPRTLLVQIRLVQIRLVRTGLVLLPKFLRAETLF